MNSSSPRLEQHTKPRNACCNPVRNFSTRVRAPFLDSRYYHVLLSWHGNRKRFFVGFLASYSRHSCCCHPGPGLSRHRAVPSPSCRLPLATRIEKAPRFRPHRKRGSEVIPPRIDTISRTSAPPAASTCPQRTAPSARGCDISHLEKGPLAPRRLCKKLREPAQSSLHPLLTSLPADSSARSATRRACPAGRKNLRTQRRRKPRLCGRTGAPTAARPGHRRPAYPTVHRLPVLAGECRPDARQWPGHHGT